MVRQRKATLLAGAAVGWLCSATPAFAATICVEPSGADGCLTTINAGIAAAAAGDTVDIDDGSYAENVSVPAAKNGLILQGSGIKSVIVDTGPPLGGDGIVVLSSSVTITGLSVRNSTGDGIVLGDSGSAIAVTGTIIRDVQIRGVSGNGIFLDDGADNTIIDKVSVRGSGSNGIDASQATKINNLTIHGSTIRGTAQGINIFGDGAVLEANDVGLASAECVDIAGDSANATKNKATVCDGGGFSVDGDRPTLVKNSVVGTDATGYLVNCTPCTTPAGLLSGNLATDPVGDDSAFVLTSAAAGLLVEKNKALRASDPSFIVNGVGMVLRKNKAIDGGGDRNSPGFVVNDTGTTLEKNLARAVFGDGFEINDSGNTLSKNKSTRNLVDGYQIDGNGNTMTGNSSSGNLAEGIAVTGDTNVITGNKAAQNRTDLCVEGTDNTISANSAASFSNSCDLD